MALIFRGDKRKVFFMKDIANVRTIIGRKKVKVTNKYVPFNKNLFPIDTSKPTYRNKNRFMYMIDIDAGQLQFESDKCVPNDDLFDMIFHNQIVKQLVSALEKTKISGEAIIIALALLGLGLAIGYILGNGIPLSG